GVIPPMPAWRASPVTVLGDAIHLAPGFGGNLAMRDAHRLSEALADAARGRLGLLDAIGAYEDTMRRTSFTPVAAKATA
ncbi:MAG TPA: FAD-dependent monooxygenase, partial [Streptomyces sp.]